MVPRRNKTPVVVEQVQIEPVRNETITRSSSSLVPESIHRMNEWGAPYVDDSIIQMRQNVKRYLFKMCRQFANDKGTVLLKIS